MTKMGVSRLTVAKLLNHRDRDVTGRVYDQHDYAPETAAALLSWEQRLKSILDPDTELAEVVSISDGAQH